MPALSVQKLRYLEEGRTKHPDAEVLRAVATMYELDFDELATASIGRTTAPSRCRTCQRRSAENGASCRRTRTTRFARGARVRRQVNNLHSLCCK